MTETRAYLHGHPDCAAYWPAVDVRASAAGERPELTAAESPCSLDGIADVLTGTTPKTHALTQAAVDAASDLHWFQAYQSHQMVGNGTYDRTAAAMLAGPGAELAAAGGQCGFFYLQKGVEYAAHRHAPREIYAVLSGTARYWSETGGWVTRSPGEVVHTPEWSWHAMTTCWQPVLILWAWIGDALGTAPSLRDGDKGVLPPGAFDGIEREPRP